MPRVSSPKPVTPEEAMAVWSSIKNPSSRSVAKALSQAGRRVHHSTVARWYNQGWRPVAYRTHPLEAARQALDLAAGVLTGDPAAGVNGGQDRYRMRRRVSRLSGLTVGV